LYQGIVIKKTNIKIGYKAKKKSGKQYTLKIFRYWR